MNILLSSYFSRSDPCPTAHNHPLPWLLNSVGSNLDTLKLEISPYLKLALLEKDLLLFVFVCLDLLMSCAHTCAALTTNVLRSTFAYRFLALIIVFVYYLKEKFYSFL